MIITIHNNSKKPDSDMIIEVGNVLKLKEKEIREKQSWCGYKIRSIGLRMNIEIHGGYATAMVADLEQNQKS